MADKIDTLMFWETDHGTYCLSKEGGRLCVVSTPTRRLDKPTPICDAMDHEVIEQMIVSLAASADEKRRVHAELRRLMELDEDD